MYRVHYFCVRDSESLHILLEAEGDRSLSE